MSADNTQMHDYWFKKLTKALSDYSQACRSYNQNPQNGTFQTADNRLVRILWQHNDGDLST